MARRRRSNNNGDNERSLAVNKSSEFSFHCSIHGISYSSEAVDWYKIDSRNGDSYKLPVRTGNGTRNGLNVYCKENTRVLTLIIKNVTGKDVGVYECRLKDLIKPDVVKLRLHLTVKGKLFRLRLAEPFSNVHC